MMHRVNIFCIFVPNDVFNPKNMTIFLNELFNNTLTKRLLICICSLTMCWTRLYAQDVIVKKDGVTIMAKLLEVNPTDIKYKKSSNPSGPTYTINISDVMCINYENGDRDTFDTPQADNARKSAATAETNAIPFDNSGLATRFNQRTLHFNGSSDKRANALMCVLGVMEGSAFESSDLKVCYDIKRLARHFNGKDETMVEMLAKNPYPNRLASEIMSLIITLTNKTSKSIYVDLGNSFAIYSKGGAVPLYTPSSKTSGTSSSTSSGLSMPGGFGAIGFGGSEVDISSTTVYAQRIIIIPPMSTLSLPAQNLGESENYKQSKIRSHFLISCLPAFAAKNMVEEKPRDYQFLFNVLGEGEQIEIPVPDVVPMAIHLSYSFDEGQKDVKSIRTNFYIKTLVGFRDSGLGENLLQFSDMDFSQGPLLYLIRTRQLLK